MEEIDDLAIARRGMHVALGAPGALPALSAQTAPTSTLGSIIGGNKLKSLGKDELLVKTPAARNNSISSDIGVGKGSSPVEDSDEEKESGVDTGEEDESGEKDASRGQEQGLSLNFASGAKIKGSRKGAVLCEQSVKMVNTSIDHIIQLVKRLK